MRMILGVHSVCLVRVQFCCSVDLLCFVFFCQAFYILDELLVGGEIQESSKKNIIRAVNAQDVLQEVSISSSSMCLIRKKERKKRGGGAWLSNSVQAEESLTQLLPKLSSVADSNSLGNSIM